MVRIFLISLIRSIDYIVANLVIFIDKSYWRMFLFRVKVKVGKTGLGFCLLFVILAPTKRFASCLKSRAFVTKKGKKKTEIVFNAQKAMTLSRKCRQTYRNLRISFRGIGRKITGIRVAFPIPIQIND